MAAAWVCAGVNAAKPGTSPFGPGQTAHRMMPNSEYHEVLTEDRPDLDVALEDWSAKEGLLAAIFIDFLRRTERHA